MEKSFELYDGAVTLVFDAAKHIYRARLAGTPPPGRWAPGATSIAGMLDNDKTGRLQGWAVKMAVEYVERSLVLEPGGRVLVRFDGGPEQKAVPFDEVSKAALLKAAKGAYRRRAQSAADLGTMAHSWVEQYIAWKTGNGEKPVRPQNPALLSTVQAFLSWEKQHKVEYIFSERKVYALAENYAGTVDIVALVDGVRSVVDIKTSNFVNEEFWLQTAGYAHALMQEFEEPIEERWIVRLGKEDGAFDPHQASTEVDENGRARPTLEDDIKAFLALRTVFAWAKRETLPALSPVTTVSGRKKRTTKKRRSA